MDAFRILTGGTRLDKKRFQADVAHFEAPKADMVASTSTALPDELDFFGVTVGEGGAGTAEDRKAKKKERKRKRAEETAGADSAAASCADYPALLRRHKIKLTGLDLPDPVASVDDVVRRRRTTGGDAAAERAEVLARNWKSLGLRDPTGVQMAAWGTMLAGRDILACAPTGSGKTFSFIFPVLALLSPPSASPPDSVIRPQAVIVEPTRELAVQVLRETRRLAGEGGWTAAVLGEEGVGLTRDKEKEGKKGKKEKKASEADAGEAPTTQVDAAELVEDSASGAAAYKGSIDILITTPLRLVFAIKSGTVSLSTTSHLILDEADKLFELNFLEQTDEILAACAKDRPTEAGETRKGMFSATMPSSVEELAKGVMAGAGSGMVRAIVGHKEAATSTIDQTLSFVNTEDHKLLSLRSMIQGGQFTPPVLIFVQSIQRAKELANELIFDGINADAIHADRTSQERDEIVRKFAAGQIWCLICTDVMARGVDFKGVKLVINYDFPQSAMSYIHRIGRTGRAGKAGRAVTFFTKADTGHLKTIVNVMRQSGCTVPDWMLALPNPSQDAKKALKMRPLGRKDISKTLGSGNAGEEGGAKREKLKKRERIMGGKGGVFKKGKKGEVGKAEKATEAKGERPERPAKKARREVALEE
ncbi:ATP-dependent RNA helicase rok1 [Rhodotorula toruloides]|uniref:RNA helicase n=1 Tax=Rhodotorula toruloides TaxID=5286 RepID=A0A511KLU7_RHOTO|nr:ATP-dependent RNA helicase rok1 [Rhodotorula toruloides]